MSNDRRSRFKRDEKMEDAVINKYLINIGAGFDIPTAKFEIGFKGETLIIGGMASYVGVGGRQNTFKSTIADYMVQSAYDRIACSYFSTIENYDTEQTRQEDRIMALTKHHDNIRGVAMFDEKYWRLTNLSVTPGEVWNDNMKKILTEKTKDKKNLVDSPFVGRDGKQLKLPIACFSFVDSLSDFTTSDVEKMEMDNAIGDKGGNTIFMRGGLVKTRFVREFNNLANKNYHYSVMTAHIGDRIEMASGPFAPRPVSDLPHMKTTDKFKNVPPKFSFIVSIMYQATSVRRCQEDQIDTYPRRANEASIEASDLNEVTLTITRSKVCPSGRTITLVVSQTEGVLPTVSEFHNLKGAKTKEKGNANYREGQGFGIIRKGGNYRIELMPDLVFTRNNLREIAETNPQFRRAMSILMELYQIDVYHRKSYTVPELVDFYNKLDEEYGWDVLLNTRGYWTYDQYADDIPPYVSTPDLIRMYEGTYTPYWWKGKKKKKVEEVKVNNKVIEAVPA